MPTDIADVTEDSAVYALAQIGVDASDELVNKVYQNAVSYAKDRSAEMVGKKWVDGELVDNPNAELVITDSTRDEIKRIIYQGLTDNIGKAGIADAIEESAAFDSDRAEMIANTEIGTANSQGALQGYKAAQDIGINIKKIWIADEDPCPECAANEDEGPIDLDDTFQSGDDAPLAHPGCECVLSAEVDEDMDNQDNSEEDNG